MLLHMIIYGQSFVRGSAIGGFLFCCKTQTFIVGGLCFFLLLI